MMTIKSEYDIVVFGASVSAVGYIIKQKQSGKNVLLVNQLGFLGGSVTESYSCFQSIKNLSKNELLTSLTKENFYYDSDYVILNPENVKIVLQNELELAKVDMLFHVYPRKVSYQNNAACITLIAKEGNIHIKAKKIIDGTEHGQLFRMIKQEQIKNNKTNLFITRTESDLQFDEVDKIIKIALNDGRYWVSIPSNQKLNEFYDYGEHELILKLERLIKETTSRIQLLPVRSEYETLSNIISINEYVMHISSLIDKTYSINEELLKYQSIINNDKYE